VPDEPDELASPNVHVGRVLLAVAGVLFLLGGGLAIALGLYEWKAPKRTFISPSAFPQPSVLETQKQEAQQPWVSGPQPVTTSESAPKAAMPIEQAMEMIVRRGAAGYAPIEQKVLAQKTQPPSAEPSKRPSAKARLHARGRGRRRVHHS
jgi:hypothetical protein